MKGKGGKLYSVYFPAIGSASSVIFSVNVMHPVTFARVFAPFESAVANALWFNSHIGIGTYLYTRRHMKQETELQKLGYCVFGSVVFNFGTLLLLATFKNLIGSERAWLRALIGMAVTGGLLYTGKSYLRVVDDKVAE